MLHLVPSNLLLLIYDILKIENYGNPPLLAFLENLGMTLTISSIGYVINMWVNMSRKDLLLRKPLQDVNIWIFTSIIFITTTTIISPIGAITHYFILFRFVVACFGLYMGGMMTLVINFCLRHKREMIISTIIACIMFTSFVGATIHTVLLDKIEASVYTYLFWSMYRFMSNIYSLVWIIKAIHAINQRPAKPQLKRIESKTGSI